METVNLKSAITFRIVIHDDWKSEDRAVAFSTKTFRGTRHSDSLPTPYDRVPYEVEAIVIDSATAPWFRVQGIRISVLWSNVLSVQHEEVAG